jgi:hypothetical protein
MPNQFTRRNLFLLTGAGIAALRPLAAGNSDFWEKRQPSEWTNEEIDRLITKSPWAKDVNAQYAPGQSNSGGYPNGSGYPDGGGGSPGGGGGYPGGGGGGGYPGGGGGGTMGGPSIGIPGIGFPRGGGRGRGGQGGPGSAFHGTVRWDSARPIRDALKSPLPDVFDGHYVLAVTGIPLLDDRHQGPRDEDDDSSNNRRTQDDSLDNLKSLTSLQVKGKDYVQAGVVQRQVGTGNTLLFGFSKEMLPISKHDGEITFSTQMTRLIVKARFTPKEMLYHGELAV